MPRPELSQLRYPNLWQGCVGAWCPSQSGATGYRLFDDSGNNNHGTLTNMDPGTDWVPSGGKLALDFDGTNDRVDIPGNYRPSLPMTFSAWVVRTADWHFAGNCLFWAKPSAAFNGNGFYIEPASGTFSNNTICVLDGAVASYLRLNQTGNTSFSLNTWTHFAVTVANSTTGQFYLNGIPVSTSVVGSLSVTGTSDTKYIFSNSPGYGNYTPGQIDDIRIYNRALTPSEIRLLYTGGRGAAYERSRGRKKAYVPGYRITAPSRIQTGSARTIDGTDTESLSRGLVGAWCPSLGASGYRLLDRSGNNNHGTLTNMDPGTDWVPSGGRLALDFDGSNDNVALGAFTKIGEAGNKTLSVWTFLRELNRYQSIVSCWSSNAESFELFVNHASSQIAGGFYGGSGFVVTATATINTWQHWVVTQTGSVYDLYRNGVAVSTANDGGRTGTATANAFFGQRSNSFFFNGQLDDVRIYNRALTPSEIRLLYTGGRGVGLLPESKPKRARIVAWDNTDKISVPARVLTNTDSLKRGLVGHWSPSLSGPQGNRLMDLSGQNNHGTLTNMDYQTDYVPSTDKGGRMALDFDGNNDSVNTSLLMQSIPFDATVSCWAYPYRSATTSERGFLWGGAVVGLPTFDFQVYTDNNLYVGWLATGNDRRIVLSKTNAGWSQNQWQHFTFVSSTRFGSILYRNGIQVGSNTNANFVAGFTTQTLEIGSNTVVSAYNAFFGQIDDVRIYNRALTPNEIRLLAQSRMPERATPQRTRMAYWSSGLVSYLRRRTYNSILGSGVIS